MIIVPSHAIPIRKMPITTGLAMSAKGNERKTFH